MRHAIDRRRMAVVLLVLALALAAGTIPAALAGPRVGILLLPPQPVTGGVVAGPLAPFVPPGYAPPGLTPGPLASTAPPVTYFTPPLAVPVIVPGSGGRRRGAPSLILP